MPLESKCYAVTMISTLNTDEGLMVSQSLHKGLSGEDESLYADNFPNFAIVVD